jgi:hypothetical protein
MGAVRDAVTHMFVADSERDLKKWTGAVERDDDQLADKRAELDRINTALADALADDPIDDPLIVALRAKRQQLAADIEELGEVRARHMAKRDEAQEADNERRFKKQRDDQREIDKGKVRAAKNHADEFSRQMKPIPDLLSQLHERLEHAQAAAERASLVTGDNTLGERTIDRLLGHAVQQAALAPWLRDALAAVGE